MVLCVWRVRARVCELLYYKKYILLDLIDIRIWIGDMINNNKQK